MRRRRAHAGRAAGFTLVELLVAIAIGGLLATALFGAFASGTEATRTHEHQARAQADARLAMDRIARDLRQAVGYPLGVGLPLALLHTGELVLHVDHRRSADPALVPVPHRVRYAVDGDDLIREQAAPVVSGSTVTYGAYSVRETLVEGIATGASAPPVFQGVLASGPVTGAVPAGQVGDVIRVRVRLASGHRVGPAEVRDEVRADVTLRNAR